MLWVFGLVDTGSTGDYLRSGNPKENGSVLAQGTQVDLRSGGFGVATPAVVVAVGCGRCRHLRCAFWRAFGVPVTITST